MPFLIRQCVQAYKAGAGRHLPEPQHCHGLPSLLASPLDPVWPAHPSSHGRLHHWCRPKALMTFTLAPSTQRLRRHPSTASHPKASEAEMDLRTSASAPQQSCCHPGPAHWVAPVRPHWPLSAAHWQCWTCACGWLGRASRVSLDYRLADQFRSMAHADDGLRQLLGCLSLRTTSGLRTSSPPARKSLELERAERKLVAEAATSIFY
jgi:hypothetical protein